MERNKLKSYCQFCLQESSEARPNILISKEQKQHFFFLTRKKLNTSRFSGMICCEPCLGQFDAAIKYREALLENQKILENLYNLAPDEESMNYAMVEVKQENVLAYPDFPDDNSSDYTDMKHENFLDLQMKEEPTDPVDVERQPRMSINEPMELTGPIRGRKKYPQKRLEVPVHCPTCEKPFYFKAHLRQHINNVHREDRRVICPQCGKFFRNNGSLTIHMATHEDFRRYQCDVCSKRFKNSGALTRHKYIHAEIKPFKCSFCPKTFTQSTSLYNHLDIHNNIRYTCDRCGVSLSEKRTLKMHIQKCIRGIKTTQRGRRGCNGVVHEKYKCIAPGCERELSCRQYLEVHLDKVHNMRFDSFETTCLLCRKVFDSVGEYLVHYKTHTHNFLCPICKQRFKAEKALFNHMKNHTEGEDRPFVCMEATCGATFKRSAHLKSHHLNKHTAERGIQCEFCDYKCRHRGDLNIHMRTHTNLRPYACWKCEYSGTVSTALRKHMQFAHKESRIYCCRTCRQAFAYQQELAQHEKEHV